MGIGKRHPSIVVGIAANEIDGGKGKDATGDQDQTQHAGLERRLHGISTSKKNPKSFKKPIALREEQSECHRAVDVEGRDGEGFAQTLRNHAKKRPQLRVGLGIVAPERVFPLRKKAIDVKRPLHEDGCALQ